MSNSPEWIVELEIGNPPTLISTNIQDSLRLGREIPGGPGIDLSPYGAADLGVSRVHIEIKNNGNHLSVIDLNSGNGTVLNGMRLRPDIGYELTKGDVLYLGHLQIKVDIKRGGAQSSISASRLDLNLRNTPTSGKGQKILIVEDDPDLSQLYRLSLEKSNYTVQVCRDVVSAIRSLNQSTPALILLDLMLPGVHGLELCRYIRRDTNYPTIPIVVLTAVNDSHIVQQAMESGADVFVTKPPDMKELTRVIGSLIFKNETDNPGNATKRLAGTASLEHISAAPRKDTIIIFVENHREPIGVVVPTQVTLGRHKPVGSTFPHVDLEDHGAFDKGVSRVHAVIKRREGQFVIEDMSSANGTFVNGYSLKNHETIPLKNGDEVRLGELRMHVYLLAETKPDTNPLSDSPSSNR